MNFITSTPLRNEEQTTKVSTQKKLRRTLDLFQITNKSLNNSNTESEMAVRSTRKLANLFLPRILDTEEVTFHPVSERIRERGSLLKRKQALQVLQRKIETKTAATKQSRHGKKKKHVIDTIPENPCIVKERKLYIPLVRLEHTNLLNEQQFQVFKRTNINLINSPALQRLSLEPVPRSRQSFSHFLRPCWVILQRLPFKQMQQIRYSKSMSFGQNEKQSACDFIPVITSSPLTSPQLLNSMKKNISASTCNEFPQLVNKSSDCSSSDSSAADLDGTYTVNHSFEENITNRSRNAQEDASYVSNQASKTHLQESESYFRGYKNATNHHRNMNTTFDTPGIVVNIFHGTPKSALKSSNRVTNGVVRRVTFSNASVIIIDDDSQNSSYRESFQMLTPTIYPISNSDDENSEIFIKNTRVASTPFQPKEKAFINTSRVSINCRMDTRERSRHKEKPSKLLLTETCHNKKLLNGSSGTCSKLSERSSTSSQKRPNTLKNSLTRFGFKIQGSQNSTKQEQITAVSKKSKPLKSMTENMRVKIKGVRSNRRLELLMQMRRNQKS